MSMIRRNLKRRAEKKAALLANETVEQKVETELPFAEVPDKKKYTKTEINRMSTAELKQMALDKGIENADEMTGTELKKYFIDLYEL